MKRSSQTQKRRGRTEGNAKIYSSCSLKVPRKKRGVLGREKSLVVCCFFSSAFSVGIISVIKSLIMVINGDTFLKLLGIFS